MKYIYHHLGLGDHIICNSIVRHFVETYHKVTVYFVCATGISHSVKELCEYVFSSIDLDWEKYVKIDEKFLRPEELNNLKGDSSKLTKMTKWEPEYTFQTMLDEMINHWINYFS